MTLPFTLRPTLYQRHHTSKIMDPWNSSGSGESTNQTMVDLVKDANEKLQTAITNLDNGNNNDEATASKNLTPASTSAAATNSLPQDDYDPDDLAAAFFARQAMKNDADKKLRVDEWAQTIVSFPHQHRSSSEDNSQHDDQKDGVEKNESSSASSSSISRQKNLAGSLFRVFQKEFNA